MKMWSSEQIAGFTLIDLSAKRKITFGIGYIILTASANNLLNTEYYSTLSYPMPGRNYLLSFLFQPTNQKK